MTEMLFDYLTFSLKPDKSSENPRDVDLPFILRLLQINDKFSLFQNKGGLNGYPVCYRHNGVLIHVPHETEYERMGYCVMMTGDGLRWYASLFKKFDISEFLKTLIHLTKTGISVNVSRLDIALDDKDGLLNLDDIKKKAETREWVSHFRLNRKIREIEERKGCDIVGNTIYFGTRSDNGFIRFYDKAVEQGVAGHWIRCEFEMKHEHAMRIANSIALLGNDGFSKYFPKIANGMIRFIENDDTNRSRCSASKFWTKFLETAERVKLSILKYKRQNITRLLQYMVDSYSPSIYTLLQVFPQEFLMNLFVRNGCSRLTAKHYYMIENPDVYDTPYSSSEKWRLQVPLSCHEQLALSL